MKTYILRDPKTVEPQNPARGLRPEPVAPPRDAATLAVPALFIGLDVHNDSIAVSLAPSDRAEVRRYGIIGGQTQFGKGQNIRLERFTNQIYESACLEPEVLQNRCPMERNGLNLNTVFSANSCRNRETLNLFCAHSCKRYPKAVSDCQTVMAKAIASHS